MQEKICAVFVFIVSLTIAGCVSAGAPASSVRTRSIDLGSYSVDIPAKGWDVSSSSANGMLQCSRALTDSSGIVTNSSLIKVFANTVLSQAKLMTEKETVADFLGNEVRLMKSQGVDKGLYSLESAEQGETTINGIQLYSLTYRTAASQKKGGTVVDAVLYLYFPPGFKDTRRFFGFLFSEAFVPGKPTRINMDLVRSIIGSLKVRAAAAASSRLEEELFQAVLQGDSGLAQDLLDRGADPNSRDETGPILQLAALRGSVEIVQYLLAKRADVNATDAAGNTALIRAGSSGNSATVEALILAGADVNGKSVDGTSALMVASWRGNLPVVDLLLTHKADPNACHSKGETSILLALENEHEEVAARLVEAGADVNVKGNGGRTPLMGLAYMGRTDMMKLLLQAGARVDLRDDQGHTALQWARKGRSSEAEALLKANGATE
jgi:ankyrin repeat protein